MSNLGFRQKNKHVLSVEIVNLTKNPPAAGIFLNYFSPQFLHKSIYNILIIKHILFVILIFTISGIHIFSYKHGAKHGQPRIWPKNKHGLSMIVT